jgi:Fic family protein
MQTLGFAPRQEALLSTLTMDVLRSHEIEGAFLNPDQVRSSVARRLGIETAGMVDSPRNVDSVVEMTLDAVRRYAEPLTEQRLLGWQAGLFPQGFNGIHKVAAGVYRRNDVYIYSGPMGRETEHYKGPPAETVPDDMRRFLTWFEDGAKIDPVLKSGIAHFWFVSIHPFEDGNGRVARAISDMQLARAEDSPERYYSVSSQILKERKGYYAALEKAQSGDGEITGWLLWFLACLRAALSASEAQIEKIMRISRFWDAHPASTLNERQVRVLKLLLNHFEGKLTSASWAKICRCSTDTALRDIRGLVATGVLEKDAAGGRSSAYHLIENG